MQEPKHSWLSSRDTDMSRTSRAPSLTELNVCRKKILIIIQPPRLSIISSYYAQWVFLRKCRCCQFLSSLNLYKENHDFVLQINNMLSRERSLKFITWKVYYTSWSYRPLFHSDCHFFKRPIKSITSMNTPKSMSVCSNVWYVWLPKDNQSWPKKQKSQEVLE